MQKDKFSKNANIWEKDKLTKFYISSSGLHETNFFEKNYYWKGIPETISIKANYSYKIEMQLYMRMCKEMISDK